MRVDVKICGLVDEAGLEAAIEAGADAIGLVLSPSPRRVDAAAAARLLARVPRPIVRVAVVARPGPDELAIAADLPFDLLQTETPQPNLRIRQLRVFHDGPDLHARLDAAGYPPPTPTIERLEGATAANPWEHGFLLDGPAGGGRGIPADPDRAAAAARRAPLILAGGLRPETIAEVVRAVRPRAVDVSSGVESSPGRKDPARIRAFVTAVHQLEAHISGVTP